MSDINIIRSMVSEEELLCQLAEEAAGLAQAALKLRRAITGNNPTPISESDARDALYEEIADVELCQWALRLSSDSLVAINQIMDTKMKRWIKRLGGIQDDH